MVKRAIFSNCEKEPKVSCVVAYIFCIENVVFHYLFSLVCEEVLQVCIYLAVKIYNLIKACELHIKTDKIHNFYM